jgi:hypothetical protein
MAHPADRNCLFCGVFFRADARNAKHQNYCSETACRSASKAASRRAWLSKAPNQDYFRGPENVARVQAWRDAHPGYWRRARGQRGTPPAQSLALQDLCLPQAVEITEDSQLAANHALQDLWRDQPAVLIGFIAHFTGSALQDAMPHSALHLLCRTGNYAERGLADRSDAECLRNPVRHSSALYRLLRN